MPQIINTNMASLNAQRNLNRTQEQNQTALQRLSSGLRINSAKDDAAGLAIATRFTSQIRGLNQAVRNAGDGIALAQTAEGALGSMAENLQRIRELAVQSANASNSSIDREKLQKEVSQLIKEVSRTADETNFNGRKLLDGTFKDALFQVGANAGETIDISIAALTADKIGASQASGVSSYSTDKALGNGDLVINGKSISPSISADDTSSKYAKNASAIAKAAAINKHTDETGVKAVANETEVNGREMKASSGQTASSVSVKINGEEFNLQSTKNSTAVERASTRASVIEAINAKSDLIGVVAKDGGDKNGVILTAKDGRNISIEITTASFTDKKLGEAFGLAKAAIQSSPLSASSTGTVTGIYESSVSLVAVGSTTEINIDGGYGTGTGDLKNSGFTRGEYKTELATYSTESKGLKAQTSATASDVKDKSLEAGDLVINDVTIAASSTVDDRASDATANSSNVAGSAIAIAAAINKSSEQTGVKAYANENILVGVKSSKASETVSQAAGTFHIVINNVDISAVTTTSVSSVQDNRNAAIDAINKESGRTGVVAEDNGKGISLKAADGRNISVMVGTSAAGVNTALIGLDSSVDGIGKATASTGTSALSVFAANAETQYGSVRLESAKEIDIDAGSKGTDGLEKSGFSRGEFGQGEDGQFLKDVDISTAEGAAKALKAIDNALETVSNQRADLGAIQNRMSSTVSNLRVNAENLTSARSRIMDTDFAAQTAELSRTSVLQQAGISILAQANAQGQNVLSLLG